MLRANYSLTHSKSIYDRVDLDAVVSPLFRFVSSNNFSRIKLSRSVALTSVSKSDWIPKKCNTSISMLVEFHPIICHLIVAAVGIKFRNLMLQDINSNHLIFRCDQLTAVVGANAAVGTNALSSIYNPI